jgi:hypothetical protein
VSLRLLNADAAASYRWIRSRIDESGQWRGYSERNISAYFKAPWSFFSCGDRTAAELSLANIEREYLKPDGDIAHMSDILLERHPMYPHAHIAIGAALLGRVEVANRILGFAARHRHAGLEAWGALASGETQPQCNSISTSTLGLACLESGHREEARGAARFLTRLLDMQPQPQTEFLTTVLGSGELLTGASGAVLRLDQRIALQARFQAWWGIGFPVAFLARLFECSGDRQWLEQAQRYLELLDRAPQSWQDLASGKAAWGCAVLYRATGDPAFRSRALRASRALVSRMASNGAWHACINGEGGTNQAPTTMGYEACTEFALWLSLVGEAVAGREGVNWTPPARYGTENPLTWSLRQIQRISLQRIRTATFGWHRALKRA